MSASKAPGGLRAELAALRERATDGPRLPEGQAADAAAVLAYFDPFALPGLAETGPDDPTFGDIMALAEPVSDPPGFWTLHLSARRALLARMEGRAAVQAALDTVEHLPEVAAQMGFALIVEGPEAVHAALNGPSLKRVAGLNLARSWVDGVKALEDGLPSAAEIEEALTSLRRRAPLRDLVGEHFTGRDQVLTAMRAHMAENAPAQMLFIYGPGGVGKSTVLAKFALEVEEGQGADAVAYLNLDRPLLRPGEPLTLLQDLITQLADQFQQEAKFLEEVADRVAATAERFDLAFKTGSSLEAMSTAGFWEAMIGEAAESISALPGDGPILVLIDTFEQAQRLGPAIVEQMWQMFRLLAEAQPRLRIIAAGRVEEEIGTLSAVSLEAFERTDVARVLESTLGETVPEQIVEDVLDASEGHPLTVRLAAISVKNLGIGAFLDPKTRAEELARLRDERRDALLYGRILRQIGDPKVAELAVPGLVMRRITAEAIERVLAEPCGLDLGPGDAEDLFERMQREVDLVTLDLRDPNAPALVHRPEVRAMMLADLRRDRKDQARAIDEKAAAYLATQPGPFARAEYIYHLLFLGAEPETLDALWTPDLAPFLATAAEEVPPRGAAWLARRIGLDLAPPLAEAIEQDEHEETVRQMAERRIGRGQLKGALDLLQKLETRMPGSALWSLETQLLSRLGRADEALDRAARGIDALRASGHRTEVADLLLHRSLVREGLRRFARASEDVAEALEISEATGDAEMQLRAIAALLRLNRKSPKTAGPDPKALRSMSVPLLDKIGPTLLDRNAALARELAAELGDQHLQLLELVARQPVSPVPLQSTDAGTVIGTALLDRVAEAVKGDFAGLVDVDAKRAVSTLQQRLPDVLNLARDRNALKEVSEPVRMLLAAEVDQRVGAFPSPTMLARTTGLKLQY